MQSVEPERLARNRELYFRHNSSARFIPHGVSILIARMYMPILGSRFWIYVCSLRGLISGFHISQVPWLMVIIYIYWPPNINLKTWSDLTREPIFRWPYVGLMLSGTWRNFHRYAPALGSYRPQCWCSIDCSV